MDIGTILITIVGLSLLLILFFLPLFTRSRANKQPEPPLDPAREEAYKRGLLIGGLMATMGDAKSADQQGQLERAMIEEGFIEHFKRSDPE